MLNLFFSHTPSQCQGFNPVTHVSGSHLRPYPKAAGSPPGAGGQAAATGDPRRNRRAQPGPAAACPRSPRESSGAGPGCRAGAQASRSSLYKGVGSFPGAAGGAGLIPEGGFPRYAAGTLPPPRAPASAGEEQHPA